MGGIYAAFAQQIHCRQFYIEPVFQERAAGGTLQGRDIRIIADKFYRIPDRAGYYIKKIPCGIFTEKYDIYA